jgi:flagellar assembly protein FliH
MTVGPTATRFEVPIFPSLAAARDRELEAAERDAVQQQAGYIAGYERGIEAAAAQIHIEVARHRAAAANLEAAARVLHAAREELAKRDAVALRDIEQDVVTLATALAEAILCRELRATDDAVKDAVMRATALAPDRGTPIVRLHPDDAMSVGGISADDTIDWRSRITIVVDPSIEPGGCVVDVGACRIDAQIGSAIERMRSALLSS